jgi:hypothetical protein
MDADDIGHDSALSMINAQVPGGVFQGGVLYYYTPVLAYQTLMGMFKLQISRFNRFDTPEQFQPILQGGGLNDVVKELNLCGPFLTDLNQINYYWSSIFGTITPDSTVSDD